MNQKTSIFIIAILGVLLTAIQLFFLNELSFMLNDTLLSNKPDEYSLLIKVVAFAGIALSSAIVLVSLTFKSSKTEKKKKKMKTDGKSVILKNSIKTEESDGNSPKLVSKNNIQDFLPSENSLEAFCNGYLSALAKELELAQGVMYVKDKERDTYVKSGSYAFYSTTENEEIEFGVGISGQVAKNKEPLYITNVPNDYITIMSGLGKSNPKYLQILPIVVQGKTIGIIELASFKEIPIDNKAFMEYDSNVIGERLLKLMN